LRCLVEHDEIEQGSDRTPRALEQPMHLMNRAADQRDALVALEPLRQLLI
jgi:hypothetical protein